MEIRTDRYYSLYSDEDTRSSVKVTYEEDKVVEITIQEERNYSSITLDTKSFLKLMRELKHIEGVINDEDQEDITELWEEIK